MNNAKDQLVRNANESTTVFCTWKPITTRGQLQQRQQLQLAACDYKKQAIKQQKSQQKQGKIYSRSTVAQNEEEEFFLPTAIVSVDNNGKQLISEPF